MAIVIVGLAKQLLSVRKKGVVGQNIMRRQVKMTTIEYQRRIASYIHRAIGGVILRELESCQNGNNRHKYEREIVSVEKHMKIESNLYSPRCDIAVGPFAFTCRYDENYNNLLNQRNIKAFLRILLQRSENRSSENVENFIRGCRNQNRNPRAFIVIEVEGSSCRNGKLILGSMVNASIMGQVGIIIPYKNNTAQRVHTYINEMGNRGKTPKIFMNLIVIKKEKLDEIMTHHH